MDCMTSISFKDCEDAELLSLSRTISDHAAQVMVEECPTTVNFSVDLTKSSGNLHAAMGREKKQALSENVTASDHDRDEILDIIDDTIDLYSKKRKSEYREAAQLIRSIYDTSFAGININNNSEESVGINRFLIAMEGEEAKSAAETIRIDQDLVELGVATAQYDIFSKERATMKENDNSPRLQPSRRELRLDIRAFESFMNYRIRKGSEVHIALAEKINGPIADLMTVVKARQTRKETPAE